LRSSAAASASFALAACAAVAPAAPAAVGTSDGPPAGERSIPARLAAKSLLLDGAARGAVVVAVGERGHILVSRDEGATWSQSDVPTRALLTGVWMHDERLGWAVGHDETILRTRDGGATWELVRSEPGAERPLLDVWFRDAENGIAVGAYGAFLVTGDGGSTWTERPIGDDDFHLNQIAAVAGGPLYLAAEAGHLYRSDDEGASWIALASPYSGSFFGVLPLADGGLLCFGLRGNLFRSDDRGDSWRRIESGTEATLMTGAELSGGRVSVAGLAGALLESSDGGASFRGRAFDDRRAGVAIVALERAVLLLGEGGVRRLEDTP
jgi:photosystem II stability/assembly factor-like uncharacterized protein